MSEPLECQDLRFTIFPIKLLDVWQWYKKAQMSFWNEDEINIELSQDAVDWETLNERIKHFIEYILAFFAVSDGLVNETLADEIMERIKNREVRLWYNFQMMMEDIHNIVYSKLIDTYIKDAEHKNRLLNALEYFPVIKRKQDWIYKWIGKNEPLSKLSNENKSIVNQLKGAYIHIRHTAIEKVGANTFYGEMKTLDVKRVNENGEIVELYQLEFPTIDEFYKAVETPRASLALQILINIIVEGVFFTGSFAAITWIHSFYNKMSGLALANEWISRDEGMHTEFGINLYNNHIVNKLPESSVHTILKEAVEIESDFMRMALPTGLLGMNADLMTQYIQFVADKLLLNLRHKKIYNVPNPFEFMNKQSVSVRSTDFFMKTTSEYGKANAGQIPSDSKLDFSEMF